LKKGKTISIELDDKLKWFTENDIKIASVLMPSQFIDYLEVYYEKIGLIKDVAGRLDLKSLKGLYIINNDDAINPPSNRMLFFDKDYHQIYTRWVFL